MKNKLRQFIALALSVIMVFGLIPVMSQPVSATRADDYLMIITGGSIKDGQVRWGWNSILLDGEDAAIAGTHKWSTSNSGVVSIGSKSGTWDNDATVNAQSPGTAVITHTRKNGKTINTYNITVLHRSEITSSSVSAGIGGQHAFSGSNDKQWVNVIVKVNGKVVPNAIVTLRQSENGSLDSHEVGAAITGSNTNIPSDSNQAGVQKDLGAWFRRMDLGGYLVDCDISWYDPNTGDVWFDTIEQSNTAVYCYQYNNPGWTVSTYATKDYHGNQAWQSGSNKYRIGPGDEAVSGSLGYISNIFSSDDSKGAVNQLTVTLRNVAYHECVKGDHTKETVTKNPTCTTTGTKRIDWLCAGYNCELVVSSSTESIPALGHSWNAPTFKWTGNDTDGYTACTATRICARDSSHVETVNCTISTSTSGNTTTYTATAKFSDKTYTDTKTVTKQIPTYTISWDTNGDGTVDDTTTVEEGVKPTHADGSKSSNAEYTYTFTGWTPAITTATKDTTYTAQFSSAKRSYELTWDLGGANPTSSYTSAGNYEWGTAITYPKTSEMTKSGYAFDGWSSVVTTMPTSNLTITAKWADDSDGDGIPDKYQTKVTYKVVNGTWSDGTTADKVVTYTRYKQDAVTGAWSLISPAVTLGSELPTGMLANTNYSNGSWNTSISSSTVVPDTATTYTYSFSAITYTLTYNMNGGSSSDKVVSGIAPTASYTLITDKPTHAKVGENAVVFIGWTTTKHDKIYSKTDTAPTTVASIAMDGNKTVYAAWGYDTNSNTIPDVNECEYTIKWHDANGEVVKTDKNVLAGTTPVYNGETPTKDSDGYSTYSFIGWSTTQNATSPDNLTTLPKITSDTTVDYYPVFSTSEIKYTLTYDANGGSGAPAAEQYIVGTAVSELNNGKSLTHAKQGDIDVVFIGWSAAKDDKIYAKGDEKPTLTTSVTMTQDTTVYAVWGLDENSNTIPDVIEATYTIIWYNADDDVAETDYKVYSGTIPSYDGEEPTKDATGTSTYEFIGWNTDKNAATALTLAELSDITVDTIIEYYPIFSEATLKYTLTYNPNGGSGAPDAKELTVNSVETLDDGSLMTHDDDSGKEVVFLGWSKTADSKIYSKTDALPSLENSVKMTDNVTVYAVWAYDENSNEIPDIKETKYTVTWKNGEVILETDLDVLSGTKPEYSSGEPTKAADAQYTYSFAGWSTTDGSESGTAMEALPDVTADTTYYAAFSKTAEAYTLAWNFNGGEPTSDEYTEAGEVAYGTTIVFPTLEKSGYVFAGWDYAETTMPARDLTITASWNEATYTLTYDANGGSGAPEAVTGIKATERYTLDSSTIPTRTADGDKQYAFIGWSETNDDTVYTKDNIADLNVVKTVAIDADKTVYAVWGDDSNGDGIPDIYQVFFKFESDGNGTLEGEISQTVNLGAGNTTGSVAPKTVTPKPNTNYAFDVWTDGSNAEVNPFVKKTVTGGTTYTYTAHFDTDELKEGEVDPDPTPNPEPTPPDVPGDEIPDKYQKTITYTVVNGKWSDDTTANKAYVITIKEKGTDGVWVDKNATLGNTIPTEMAADIGYKAGAWNVAISAATQVTDNATYTYKFVDNIVKITYIGTADEDGNNVLDKAEINIRVGKELTVNLTGGNWETVPDGFETGSTITVGDNGYELTAIPVKDGNVFTGWTATTDSEGNVTLTATWAADENDDDIPDKYQKTVTFEVENGTLKDNVATTAVATLVDANGKWSETGSGKVTVPADGDITPDTGYTIGTWSKTVEDGKVTINASDSNTLTHTCVKTKHTITYKSDKDGATETVPEIPYGTKYYVDGIEKNLTGDTTLPEPTPKPGYEKAYYTYENDNGTHKFTTVSCDPINYTITYYPDNGTHSNTISTYTVETDTFQITDAEKQGYAFDGWYKESSFTNKVTEVLKGSTGDLNLYAKFVANANKVEYPKYDPDNPKETPETTTTGITSGNTVTADLNGGAWTIEQLDNATAAGWALVNGETDVYVITSTGNITLVGLNPAKDGSVFMGWEKVETDGNITLTAQWAADAKGKLEGGNETGDGTPDKYQAFVKFESADNGTVTGDAEHLYQVFTFVDGLGNYSESGDVTPTEGNLTANPASGYAFDHWTKDSDTAKVNPFVTMTNVAGGTIITFKANFATDNKGKLEGGNETGDGTPDKYQAFVKFESADTNTGTVTGTGIYQTFTFKSGEAYTEKGDVTPVNENITVTPEAGYAFDIWTKDSETAKVDPFATMSNVTGGTTITFKANFATDNKGKLEGGDETGDGTPDKYQAFVKFESADNGTVTGDTYQTFTFEDNATSGTVDPVMTNITTTPADGYAFDLWKKDGSAVNPDTAIDNVAGGTTITFTAYFDTDTKGNPSDPEHKGDGIPDKYQKLISFTAVNGKMDGETIKTIVATLRDPQGNLSEDGTCVITVPTVVPDEGYGAGNWSPTIAGDTITVDKDTDTAYIYTCIGNPRDITYPAPNPTDPENPIIDDYVIENGKTLTVDLDGGKWTDEQINDGWTPDASDPDLFSRVITSDFDMTDKFDPTRDGYKFLGWDAVTDSNGDVTFTAKWSKYYTVTVLDSYASVTGQGQHYAGETVTIDAGIRSSYTFTGWTVESGLSSLSNSESTSTTFRMPDNAVTLRANWKSNGFIIVQATLDFETNGGTALKSVTKILGTVVDLADYTTARAGYTFEGWYSDAELTSKVTSVKLNKDMTVYAKWSELPPYVPDILDNDEHYAYIVGYADGTIRPEANITRAEVATIFFRLLKEETRDQYLSTESFFTDVNPDAWYNTAISTIANLGIMNGYPDGSFHPDTPMTRAEFAAMTARLATMGGSFIPEFSDLGEHWGTDEIILSASHGWVTGYPDGSFNPDVSITRAEAMTIINRVLARTPETADDLLDGMKTFADNLDPEKWYYLAVQEATNSHKFVYKTLRYEAWLELTENRDWSLYQ